jgi:hypothetical protein
LVGRLDSDGPVPAAAGGCESGPESRPSSHHDLKLRFLNDRSSRALGFIAVNCRCRICFFAIVLRSSSS